jgi:hypothetical protein
MTTKRSASQREKKLMKDITNNLSLMVPELQGSKKTKSQQGKASRRKGHAHERWLVNELKGLFPKARRLLEYQAGMGIDLEHTGQYRFQCKATKDYCPINKINEIPIEENTIRVLVTKGDRKEPMVVMPFKEFKAMLETVVLADRDGK